VKKGGPPPGSSRPPRTLLFRSFPYCFFFHPFFVFFLFKVGYLRLRTPDHWATRMNPSFFGVWVDPSLSFFKASPTSFHVVPPLRKVSFSVSSFVRRSPFLLKFFLSPPRPSSFFRSLLAQGSPLPPVGVVSFRVKPSGFLFLGAQTFLIPIWDN